MAPKALHQLGSMVMSLQGDPLRLSSWRGLKLVRELILRCAVFLAASTFWLSNDYAGPAQKMPAVCVEDLSGKTVDPFRQASAKALVFIFVSVDCPISNSYAPEIQRLARDFAGRDVIFHLVYPNLDETPEQIRKHLKEHDYHLEALRDTRHELAKAAEAHVTPEACIFVPGQGLVYRGRIDDRFVALGKARSEATQHDLKDALLAVLAGKPVAHPVTSAVGCYISLN